MYTIKYFFYLKALTEVKCQKKLLSEPITTCTQSAEALRRQVSLQSKEEVSNNDKHLAEGRSLNLLTCVDIIKATQKFKPKIMK